MRKWVIQIYSPTHPLIHSPTHLLIHSPTHKLIHSTTQQLIYSSTHPLIGRVASLLEVCTGFHPELTGRENIYFNGAILGMTKQEIEDKFDEIVAFLEVEMLDTPVDV